MQGAAFARLGQFYAEVAADLPRAQKCFQRALALDPSQEEAGIFPPFPLVPIVCAAGRAAEMYGLKITEYVNWGRAARSKAKLIQLAISGSTPSVCKKKTLDIPHQLAAIGITMGKTFP